MNYRKFGNTGEKISALGFGCMRFPEYEKDGKMYVDQDKVDEMVAEAYRQGVNYFDTAPKYCNCNSEEAVGRAVKGFRDKVLLSTKIPLDVCKKPGDYRRALEHSLDKLGTDHLDFYHEYVNVEQMYLAGIKEVRTKLEILDDEFHHRGHRNIAEPFALRCRQQFTFRSAIGNSINGIRLRSGLSLRSDADSSLCRWF